MNNHRTVSIADQVFDRLEMDILSGVYAKGEPLGEVRLSSELGVSRTPIREALRRLEQEKLVEESGNGIVVVGISRDDMLDMYEIREKLEGLAAARAAERISDTELDEMAETLDMQRFYLEKQTQTGEDRSDKIRDLDSVFHRLLLEASGSRIYTDTLLSMHKKIAKYRKASVRNKSRAAESVREHFALYEALRAHDSAAAAKAAENHIRSARDSMIGLDANE